MRDQTQSNQVRSLNHSSRFIADPNLAYRTSFNSFISLSHSSILSFTLDISLSTLSRSRSRRFCARERGRWTNVSPTLYLPNRRSKQPLHFCHTKMTHNTDSSSSANSSSVERSSNASFSCYTHTAVLYSVRGCECHLTYFELF